MDAQTPIFTVDSTPDFAPFIGFAVLIGAVFLVGMLCLARATRSRSKALAGLGAVALVATVAGAPVLAAHAEPVVAPAAQLVSFVEAQVGVSISLVEAEQILSDAGGRSATVTVGDAKIPISVISWSGGGWR